MSQLNLKRLIGNIKSQTNVYTPLIEAIVNSIEAIDESKRKNGKIVITFKRANQQKMKFNDDALSDISDIIIEDNGIGFTKKNRDSFDTLYTDLKIKKGGKGFGRFTFLKYFKDVRVESCYKKNNSFFIRKFSFGVNNEIVGDEIDSKTSKAKDTKTILHLSTLNKSKFDKKIDTIARKLLESLLVFFINENYKCPKIILKEDGVNEEVVINDLLLEKNGEIKLIDTKEFSIEKKDFKEYFLVKIFKIYYTKKQSTISLTADNREVIETPLHSYVPEFADDFYDVFKNEKGENYKRNYMIKSYILGSYLDKNVSLERGNFEFPDEPDLFFSITQSDIEKRVADITKDIFNNEVLSRQKKKIDKIKSYVNNDAPWHKVYLKEFEYAMVPYNISNEGIELEFQKVKFQKEQSTRREVKKVLVDNNGKNVEEISILLNDITDAQKSDLAHYVCNRLFRSYLTNSSYDMVSLISSCNINVWTTICAKSTDQRFDPYSISFSAISYM